jgi:hypothetical protein
MTFAFIPGDVFSETFAPHFHKAAIELRGNAKFVKINCAKHSSYCRSRKVKHLPWVETYLPNIAAKTFEQQARIRLLSSEAEFSVIPYRSDYSYNGILAALQEMEFVSSTRPYKGTEEKIWQELSSLMKA